MRRSRDCRPRQTWVPSKPRPIPVLALVGAVARGEPLPPVRLREKTTERVRLARRVRDERADVRESLRAHPELKSTFLSLRAAEAFATQRIADPADCARFLELVRNAMTGSVRKGEPLPSVRLRESRTRSEAAPSDAVTGKREEPTR